MIDWDQVCRKERIVSIHSTIRAAVVAAIIVIAIDQCAAAALGPDVADSPRTISRFDQGWRFHLGDAAAAKQPGFDDRAWRTLDLPHDWSIELPFDARNASGTGYLPGGVGWYRKSFRLPAAAAGKFVRVIFDGVYMDSEVWINGHYLGKRPYGYISFDYDITPHLLPAGQDNVLAVRVDHSAAADSRWYNGSGIYRHVWLVTTGAASVAPWGTFVTTPEVSRQAAVVSVETKVMNKGPSAAVTLATTIEDGAGKVVASAEGTHAIGTGGSHNFQQSARIADPRLWSPETPNLYRVVSRLTVAGKLVDEIRTPLGIRSFTFDADKGFFLNGRKTLIKGVCLHHDAGCLGAAVPDRAWERRLQLLKELGCNAIRTSHNPPNPEFLDLCDRLGFLVMDEAFDEWARPKKKWVAGRNLGQPSFQGYAQLFDQWGIKDIQSMVDRDKNHPSIILWSIGNEIDYAKDPYYDPVAADYHPSPGRPSAADLPAIAAKLIAAIKRIDTTRPVTAALADISVSNRMGLAELLDVVGYNYQEKFYAEDHARYPRRKIIGSENSHAYAAWKPVEDLTYANGQFLWTGIDFIGEASRWPIRGSMAGLLDECGFKKPQYYFRQSLWSDKPMVYLIPARGAGRRFGPGATGSREWRGNPGERVAVLCYTNCEQVELLLNGRSLGEKRLSAANNRVLAWDVPYADGSLTAVGKSGGQTVCSFELMTVGKPQRIRLSPDRTSIAADARDLAHVEVSVVDAAGNTVTSANDTVHFEISGPGRIIGVDSGDQTSHESFKAPARAAFHGKCLVIVQSNATPGSISLKATAPGLAAGQIDVTSQPATE
jgi:beta-galactosidase